VTTFNKRITKKEISVIMLTAQLVNGY